MFLRRHKLVAIFHTLETIVITAILSILLLRYSIKDGRDDLRVYILSFATIYTTTHVIVPMFIFLNPYDVIIHLPSAIHPLFTFVISINIDNFYGISCTFCECY